MLLGLHWIRQADLGIGNGGRRFDPYWYVINTDSGSSANVNVCPLSTATETGQF